MARFLCFILLLVVVALASALWVQAGGNNPLLDLLAYAEARAQTVSFKQDEAESDRSAWSTAPAYAGAPVPSSSSWPAAAPPPGQLPPDYRGPGQVGPPFATAGGAERLQEAPVAAAGQSPLPANAGGFAGPLVSLNLPTDQASASDLRQLPVAPPAYQEGGVVPASYPATPTYPVTPDGAAPANTPLPSPVPSPNAPITYPQTPEPQPLATAPPPLAPVPQNSAVAPSAVPGLVQPVSPTPLANAPPPAPEAQPFERTQVLARVGPEVILLGDVVPNVEMMLAEALKAGRIPEQQLPMFREYLIRMQVKELVSRKLIYLDAKRTIPAANFPTVESQMADAWDKEVLKSMVRRMGVDNPAQLDAKLREAGSTLDREKRNFVEQTLSSQWLRSKIDEEKEITHESMLQYYQQHVADYQFPSRARWEHLMVRSKGSNGDAEAYAKLAQMGNHIWSGVPWTEVAKRESDGPTAAQGGVRDWTNRGSLVSTTIDRALFELPPGTMSPIIKDDQGFHIVRVIERTEAGQTPFSELQATIKKRIRDDDLKEQRTQFVERLKRGVPIWTAFDGEAAADMVSLEQRQGRNQ